MVRLLIVEGGNDGDFTNEGTGFADLQSGAATIPESHSFLNTSFSRWKVLGVFSSDVLHLFVP